MSYNFTLWASFSAQEPQFLNNYFLIVTPSALLNLRAYLSTTTYDDEGVGWDGRGLLNSVELKKNIAKPFV